MELESGLVEKGLKSLTGISDGAEALECAVLVDSVYSNGGTINGLGKCVGEGHWVSSGKRKEFVLGEIALGEGTVKTNFVVIGDHYGR